MWFAAAQCNAAVWSTACHSQHVCRLPNAAVCRTFTDPEAAAFISRFSRLSRDTHLAYLTSLNTTASLALRSSLQLITPTQWPKLQDYVGDLAASFGMELFGLPQAQPFVAGTRAAIQVRLGAVFRRKRGLACAGRQWASWGIHHAMLHGSSGVLLCCPADAKKVRFYPTLDHCTHWSCRRRVWPSGAPLRLPSLRS